MKRMIALVILVAPVYVAGAAEVIRLPATADVWVSAYGKETQYSMGATNQLKLKGIQEMSLIRFDPSKLKGRRILGGHLYLKESGKKNALRKIGLSTVSARWVEGKGGAYQLDEAGHGATFMEASYRRRPWAYDGSCLSDVTMGNGNTLQHHTERIGLPEGWIRVNVPDYLIRALAASASDGLLMMDDSGQTRANNYVFSRHQPGAEPYLAVRLGAADADRPRPPRLKLRPAPERATLTTGAAVLQVLVRRDAFSYDIKLNGKPLERWRIPFPPGVGEPVLIGGRRIPPTANVEDGWQIIVLEDLPPKAALAIEVRCVGANGLAGEWIKAAGASSPALPAPRQVRPVKLDRPSGDPPEQGGALRVWALPDLEEVDPTGRRDRAKLRGANAVWSARDGAVVLSAARGEIVAFQLCIDALKGKLGPVRVVPASFVPQAGGSKAPIDRSRVSLFAVWYVRAGGAWHGEYAIPLRHGEGFDIPRAGNKIAGQRNQAVFVDVFVPPAAPPGEYRGSLSVLAQGVRPIKIPVRLTVHDFTLPDEMNFYGDLNCYGGPGRAGSARFRASHRLAHAHRCTFIRVPYNHAGRVQDDVAPPVSGRGEKQRVSDWRRFDRDVGPLFDGSMFKGCPRDGVPVNYFYLPFHENWPNRLADHFTYRGPQRGTGIMRPFALNARPPQEAFSKEFRQGFRAVAGDFARHAKKRGWTRTRFLGSYNNKWYYRANKGGRGSHGVSWWCFDEPDTFDDFEAIAFLGGLFKQGVRDVKGVHFIFRADISRVRWQRNWMNGLLDLMCVSRDLSRWPRRCEIIRREGPCAQVYYGSCNAVEEPNVISYRWCLRSYLLGADGVLPWQTIGGDSSFDRPNRNGIVVDGARRFGVPAVASLRLKALRRGVQDVEYLVALSKRRGWNREQMRCFLTGTGDYRKATRGVDRWTVRHSASVREAVARLIARPR